LALLAPAAALTDVEHLVTEAVFTVNPKVPQNDRARHQLLDLLNRLGSRSDLLDLAKLYKTKTGRDLHNDLQKAFAPWPDTRRHFTALMAGLQVQMPWNAFVEQLAIGAAYADKDDLSDAKGADANTNLAEVIQKSGYHSLPLVRGRWGLQFRMFKPIPGHTPMFPHPAVPIMAFRGTEGVKPPWAGALGADREGMTDTYIGDLTRLGAGYPQVLSNLELISRNAASLDKSLMTGHSLGGGIAQIVTAKLPQFTSECITFSAPGIAAADAKSLEGKKIPSTHHRTGGDIVPISGDASTPGKIITYDRFVGAANGQDWNRDRNVATTHNSMPVHTMMNYTNFNKLLPIEQEIMNRGVSGPNRDDAQRRTISVVSSVVPTSKDPAVRAGERSLSIGVTRRVFMANLGYNLAVEYVQREVAKLDPARMDRKTINRELQALSVRIIEMDTQVFSKESYDLYESLGVHSYDAMISKKILKIGDLIDVSNADRALVQLQVAGTWKSWWPGHSL